VTGTAGPFYATVRADGNFCVYPGRPGDGGDPLWCVNRTSGGAPSYLLLNGDGNLLLNTGTPERPTGSYWQSGVVWASVTVAPPPFGAIRWNDDGSVCPPSCARDFRVGDSVSLSAWPPAGGIFKDWTGGRCRGDATADPCVAQVPAYSPSTPPIGARITSSPSRFANAGKAGLAQPTTLWWGPDGTSQSVYAGANPPTEASFFVIDGDTIRPASNRSLCWTYYATARSIDVSPCGTPRSPGGLQTGWAYKPADKTIRNTNFPAACADIAPLTRLIMTSNSCLADDPRAPDTSWVSRFSLQP